MTGNHWGSRAFTSRLFALRNFGGATEGFTLLEVLIALTILGFSLAVLFGVFAETLNRLHETRMRMAAREQATLLLAQAGATPTSELTDSTGTAPGGLSWRLSQQPYGSAAERNAWTFHPVVVSAIVTWRDGGRKKAISFSTLRLLPKETSP